MICTFFGHSVGFYEPFTDKLTNILIDFIENRQVDTFYTFSGGAYQAIRHAQRRHKPIIPLCDDKIDGVMP